MKKTLLLVVMLVFSLSLTVFASTDDLVFERQEKSVMGMDYEFFVIPDIDKNIKIEIKVNNKNPVKVYISRNGEVVYVEDFVEGYGDCVFEYEKHDDSLVMFDVRVADAYQIGNDVDCTLKFRTNHTYSNWAVNEICDAILNNLVSSSMQENYQNNVTRGEFCSLIYRLMDSDIDVSSDIFVDTDDPAIEYLGSVGIVKGLSSGVFGVDRYITREEAAVIVDRASNFLNVMHRPIRDFEYTDDLNMSEWARSSVYKMKSLKLMTGAEGEFKPKNNLSREEAILIVDRLYNLYNGKLK